MGRGKGSLTTEQRLWDRVDKSGPVYADLGPCWVYLGNINDQGYGRVWDGEKMQRSHRLAYEIAIGPIPLDMEVHHKCNNRRCVNPRHLEIIDHVAHGSISGKLGGVPLGFRHKHCRRGHLLDEQNRHRMGDWDVCKECYTEAYRRGNAKQRERRDRGD